MATPIGTLGNVTSFSWGLVSVPDNSNVKILSFYGDATNLNNTPRVMGTSSGYLVPGGKVFTVVGLLFIGDDPSNRIGVGYADNDVGQNSTSSFTNYIDAVTGGSSPVALNLSATTTFQSIPIKLVVPTGKYLAVQQNNGPGNSKGYLLGYEV